MHTPRQTNLGLPIGRLGYIEIQTICQIFSSSWVLSIPISTFDETFPIDTLRFFDTDILKA
ncbi:MAG: hypothetical protein PUP92_27715 [Rhizonema sp. PD38]|nr:hypothetical protein [Rhizonema sp. PD38]